MTQPVGAPCKLIWEADTLGGFGVRALLRVPPG